MSLDEFSLCWDNFHLNISSGLSSLLKDETLVDVTLAAEGRYLKAHKTILSICSPYFRDLFMVNPCQHPIVFLKDVSYNVLRSLLDFMYQGEVKVAQDDLTTFIKTAEALKIKGLTGDNSSSNKSKLEEDAPALDNNHALDPLQQSHSQSQPQSQSKPKPKSQPQPQQSKKSIPVAQAKTPLPRKKLLGPASKRFRVDPEQSPSPSGHLAVVNEVKTLAVQPKIEPEELNLSFLNEDEQQYDQSTMDGDGGDDTTMDNSNDYLMEAKDDFDMSGLDASTSAVMQAPDTDAENQGLYKYVITQQGSLNLVLHQHVFRRKTITTDGRSVWVCTWRGHHCRAKCMVREGKLVSKKGMHSHPSQQEFIMQKEMYGRICYRHLF